MEDREKNLEEIKVVDRRRFGSAGEVKATEQNVSPRKEEKAQKPEARENLTSANAAPEVDFSTFVVSLATQAMMLMGEVPEELKQEEANLPAAKQTIDIIAMMEEKTSGNLNEQEKKLISDVLMSLRMAYVSLSKKK